MRTTLIWASLALALTFFSPEVSAQSEPSKVELGVHFTSITKSEFDSNSEAGF